MNEINLGDIEINKDNIWVSNEDLLNGAVGEKPKNIVDEFNKLSTTDDKKRSIENLSDEDLDKLLSNLSLYDEEDRTFVFPSEDEAIIFSSGLQESNPMIRFCKIDKCFSIHGGIFYTVEPMTTVKAQEKMSEEELKNTNNDIIVPNEIIFMLIIERRKRQKAKENNNKE